MSSFHVFRSARSTQHRRQKIFAKFILQIEIVGIQTLSTLVTGKNIIDMTLEGVSYYYYHSSAR